MLCRVKETLKSHFVTFDASEKMSHILNCTHRHSSISLSLLNTRTSYPLRGCRLEADARASIQSDSCVQFEISLSAGHEPTRVAFYKKRE